MHFIQRRFIILTETLPVSSLTFLTGAWSIHRMGHCCVEAGRDLDPAGDGTRGPGTWWGWSYKTYEIIGYENGSIKSFPPQHRSEQEFRKEKKT